MKKLKIFSVLALVFLLNVASMCSNDDDDTVPVLDPAQVSATISSGSWRVTQFIDSGNDHTGNFSGYNFTFNSNGTISATNGGTTHNGTWSIDNDGSNDDSQSDLDFNIAFSSPANFAELTEDWHFNLYTPTKIILIHVSGGGGGTDYLTFEKN